MDGVIMVPYCLGPRRFCDVREGVFPRARKAYRLHNRKAVGGEGAENIARQRQAATNCAWMTGAAQWHLGLDCMRIGCWAGLSANYFAHFADKPRHTEAHNDTDNDPWKRTLRSQHWTL
jgi:hypothetical protein